MGTEEPPMAAAVVAVVLVVLEDEAAYGRVHGVTDQLRIEAKNHYITEFLHARLDIISLIHRGC